MYRLILLSLLTTTLALSCRQMLSCSMCSGLSGCGWCDTTYSCVSNLEKDECQNWYTKECPPCSEGLCGPCLGNGLCGWCNKQSPVGLSGYCLPLNEKNCDDFYEDHCPGVDSICAFHKNKRVCLKDRQCGYCEHLGICLNGNKFGPYVGNCSSWIYSI